jgi:hypothetical protein
MALNLNCTAQTGTLQLTQEELEGLVHMYQEEKMARDVYLKMAELYNVPIFENIAKSEERHKEAVASLLEKAGYDLSELEQLGVGEFKDEELQNLYNTFTIP